MLKDAQRPVSCLRSPVPPFIYLLSLVLLFTFTHGTKSAFAACTVAQPNILLILMDDVGIEHLQIYGLQEVPVDYANTPNLTTTWDLEWLQFNNAWSSPLCSPTRATVLSGLYGVKEDGSGTGVGNLVGDDTTWGLEKSNVADHLPKLLKNLGGGLSDYATGAFGKWHLGTSDGSCQGCVADQGGDDAPGVTGGFDYFKGFILDQQDPAFNHYFHHFDTTNGVTNPVAATTYLTEDITDWASTWINAHVAAEEEPWFAYVAHRAPHAPFHCPPDRLTDDKDCVPSYPTVDKYQLMIESLDFEINRLLIDIAFDPTDTLLIVASDNGSPEPVRLPPTKGGKVKGTVSEGGIRVPMFFGGCLHEDVEGLEVNDIVGLSDLFATVLEVSGAGDPRPTDEDSQNLEAYLEPAPGAVRDKIYSEIFFPNFEPGSGFAPCRGFQAARDDTFKYVRRFDLVDAFYDLSDDEWEGPNLINDITYENQILELSNYVDSVAGKLHNICGTGGKTKTGDPCSQNSDCCSNMCSGATLLCQCPAQ